MTRPRLFAELPAGLSAVSLRLHGGEHCRPPISRMGNKAGYSSVILAALGLRSGQGADAYLWAEADPDVSALLRTYPDAEMLRRVAEIIRGWAGEEPRALWERLRAERKARGPAVSAVDFAGWVVLTRWGGPDADYSAGKTDGFVSYGRATSGGMADACHRLAEYATETAAWMWVQRRSAHGKGDGYHGGNDTHHIDADAPADACHRLAEYAAIVSGNRLVNMAGPALMNTGNGGTRHGGEFATPVGEVAERFEGMARDVAAHAWMVPRSWMGLPGSGFRAARAEPTPDHQGGANYQPDAPAPGLRDLATRGGWPPVLVLPRIPEAADVAEWLGTPGDLEGCVVYSDPPYVGTTGYAATLSREEVVRHALAYAALGAVVCVSEAEALRELVAAGWYSAEITAGRKGQKRTFSRQVEEHLTMNREPAHRVATQPSLWGPS